jgi:RNA polymerase sigma-70 factor, ECF subfamily
VTWWGEIEPRIIALGQRYLDSHDAALDLAQDVAFQAFMEIDRFTDAQHFTAWTMTRARWLALDQLKVRRRVRAMDHLSETDLAVVGQESREAEDLLGEVRNVVATLPPRQRVVLERTIDGASISEIARELAVSEATVRSLLRHARYRLSKLLT